MSDLKTGEIKKVAFYTLGCKLNFSETSTLAREFVEGGYERALKGERADICVINTCSVTGDADKKCRNLVRKVIGENEGAIVAVTGCYAQLKPNEVAAIEGVDLVVGNNNKGEIFERISVMSGKSSSVAVDGCAASELKNFFNAFSSGDRTRAFLKVQDGCDYKCSYCTIPLARGASRNISIAEIVAQADEIARRGQKEVVLTGVNIGDFGKSNGETFFQLIQALDAVEGVERYRISSIEPNLLTDEIISFCAQSRKFMPHFHIPLQSGSDTVLGAMRRRYNTAKFADRVKAVKSAMPDAFIGVDVIVGFNGETQELFDETVDFLKQLDITFLHIFPYSERDNTDAVNFTPKVDRHTKSERVAVLGAISDVKHRAFMDRFVGHRAKVLVESTRKGEVLFGFTENYIKVELPYDRKLINQIVDVQLGEITENGNLTTIIL